RHRRGVAPPRLDRHFAGRPTAARLRHGPGQIRAPCPALGVPPGPPRAWPGPASRPGGGTALGGFPRVSWRFGATNGCRPRPFLTWPSGCSQCHPELNGNRLGGSTMKRQVNTPHREGSTMKRLIIGFDLTLALLTMLGALDVAQAAGLGSPI